MAKNKTRIIAFTGIMAALVFIATFSIRVPIPFSTGYIHLGDSMVFLAALLLGWKYGAFAAGFGSMAADILGGYPQWALPTLIIKATMALLAGLAVRLTLTKSKIFFTMATMVVWSLYILIMRQMLSVGIGTRQDELIEQMEAVSDATALSQLSATSHTILYISMLAVFALVFGLWFNIRKKDPKFNLMYMIGLTAGGLWMVAAYYVTEWIIYGNAIIPIFSIPLNLLQFVVGFVLANAIYVPLKKANSGLLIEP